MECGKGFARKKARKMKEDKRKKRDKGMERRKVETTPFYRVSFTAFQKKRQLRNLNIKYVVSPLLLERWTHRAGGLRRTFTGISFTQTILN